MIVGVVSGFLVICTVGFLAMLGLLWHGVLSFSGVSGSGKLAYVVPPPTAAELAAVQPPAANIPKSDRPKVELFVMSYCPYGLQMQKGLIPAQEALKNKADIDVKFVHYAMHGLKEVEENSRQHCLESEQPKVYPEYVKCFTTGGNSEPCLASAKVNTSKLKTCIDRTDKQFGVMAQYNDQSKWLSGQFPIYPVDKALSEKYGVQGSPTLVINGTVVDSARSPEAIKQSICAAFNNPPAECQKTLATVAFVPGFGVGTDTAGGGGSATPGCGT